MAVEQIFYLFIIKEDTCNKYSGSVSVDIKEFGLFWTKIINIQIMRGRETERVCVLFG